jgi:hypothetical protein
MAESLAAFQTPEPCHSVTWRVKLSRVLSKAEYDEALLRAHRVHDGVYRRVADKLGIDPSYMSAVLPLGH